MDILDVGKRQLGVEVLRCMLVTLPLECVALRIDPRSAIDDLQLLAKWIGLVDCLQQRLILRAA